MSLTKTMRGNLSESYHDKCFREEKEFRQDRLVEKWSRMPEIGRGIQNMNVRTARNLATLLENQTQSMSKMSEAQLAATFNGYTPKHFSWVA